MESYKERMIIEYNQLKERYIKLKNFCNKIEAAQIKGTLEPVHDCPLAMLREQQNVMGKYLHLLELRSHIENVDLNHPVEFSSPSPVDFATLFKKYLYDNGYRYVAKDADGEVYAYKSKPVWVGSMWDLEQPGPHVAVICDPFTQIFKNLSISDCMELGE